MTDNDKYINIINNLPIPNIMKISLIQNIKHLDKKKLIAILKKYSNSVRILQRESKIYKIHIKPIISWYDRINDEQNDKNNVELLLKNI